MAAMTPLMMVRTWRVADYGLRFFDKKNAAL